jgi:uncharacterized membrane protein YfcA
VSEFALAWCVVSLAVAGVVKGVLGIGIPLVSISLLSMAVPVPFAVALLPIPMLVANVWQSARGGYFGYTVRRFWPLLLAMLAGVALGAQFLVVADPRMLDVLVGVAVVVFTVTTFLDFRLSVPAGAERVIGVAAGAVGGALGGVSTLFGPPIVMFLVALGLDKDRFVGCVSTIYLFCSIALLAAFTGVDFLGPGEWLRSALAALPLLAGMLLGQTLRGRADEALFRRLLMVVLLLSGMRLIAKAFGIGV